MAENRDFRPEQAEEFYKKGLELKAKGLSDRALTEFRRAVLSDARHALSHFEIGLLTRQKGHTDPQFLKYSFESFRKAARLDLNHQEAHDQYIMVGHKLGLLDEIHSEYDAWAKQFPDNALMQRCAKNIVTMSMALIPDQVSIGSGANSSGIRKIILFASIGLIVIGIGLVFSPVIAKSMSRQLTKEQIAALIKVGAAAFCGGAAGFFVRSKFH